MSQAAGLEVVIFGEGLERVAVRQITPQIYWLTHCLGDLASQYYKDYFALLPNAEAYAGDRIVDYPFSAFLILDEKNLLIDTIAPRQEVAMLMALDHILGNRKLDFIWISHVELPHAGNAAAIQRKYPSARYVTIDGGDHYAAHGLEAAIRVRPGEMIELGRHRLETIDPLFVDHGLSQWAYEHHTGMLFTADWGHNLHEPACGQCFQFLDEMLVGDYDEGLLIEDIKINAWYQFPWLAWTDPDEIAAAVDDLFARYAVRIFAPSHGSVIQEVSKGHIAALRTGMRRAAALSASR